MTDTTIDFLDDLGGDLRLAAARETVSRSSARPHRLPPRRPSRRWLKVGAAAAAFLAVAGIVGTFATGGSDLPVAGEVARSTGGGGVSDAAPAPAGDGHAARDAFEGYTGALGASAGVTEDAAAPPADAPPATIPGAPGVPGEFSKVIKTANLSVEVERDTFDERFQRASEIADELGGFVTTQSAGVRSGSLVLRVPSRYFNRARALLKDLGVRTIRDGIQGTDVTAEFVDLKARLEILQARRDALTTLLREADSLEEILRLNDAVDDVLIRIEELKGRVKLINDQTSKATISVELHEEGAAPQDDDDASIVDAWSSSIDGFLRVVGAIVIGIGYLLPIVVLAGLGWVVVRSARRRPAER